MPRGLHLLACALAKWSMSHRLCLMIYHDVPMACASPMPHSLCLMACASWPMPHSLWLMPSLLCAPLTNYGSCLMASGFCLALGWRVDPDVFAALQVLRACRSDDHRRGLQPPQRALGQWWPKVSHLLIESLRIFSYHRAALTRNTRPRWRQVHFR